jgi:hypothetical protein
LNPKPQDGIDDHGSTPRNSEEAQGRSVALVPASSVRMEQTRWAWEDRIPLGGVTLLAGQEGSGKTTILADVLARASRGRLPGDLIGTPVGCVYATAEDSYSRTLAPRMAAAGADLTRIFFVEVDGLAGGLSIPGDLAKLVERMRATGSRFLILDPLGAHLGATLDTHRDSSVRQALAPLATFMDQLGGACVGVMHWSKAPTTVALDRVNGSRGFTAAARAMLAVAEDPQDQSARVLILAKSNLGRLDVPALRYRIESRNVAAADGNPITTSGVVWMGEAADIGAGDVFRSGDPDDQSTDEAMAMVLRDALADGPKNRPEMKTRLRAAGYTVSDKGLQRACTRLGVVRHRTGFGGQMLFALPPHGGQSDGAPPGGVQNVHIEGDQHFPGLQSGQLLHSGQVVGVPSTLAVEDQQGQPPPPDDSLFLEDEEAS